LYDFHVDNHPFTRALRSRHDGAVIERGVKHISGHHTIAKIRQKVASLNAVSHALWHWKRYRAIICWQQDIGLILAACARLLGKGGAPKIHILTFIAPARRREGIVRKAIGFALGARQTASIICYGRDEETLYRQAFPEGGARYARLMLSEEYPGVERFPATRGEDYVAAGRSNRDYDFLLRYFAARPHLPLLIINDDPTLEAEAPNIRIARGVYRDEYMRLISQARALIIPFADPTISAGQMVFLHALELGKPAICTRSACLADYLVDGVNGIEIEKTERALDTAITRLEDPLTYEQLTMSARADHQARFSFDRLARDVLSLAKRGEPA
jgi:glycosyltransferase involved in cell wall biosynthesis